MDLRHSVRELIILALGWAHSQRQENLLEWIKYLTKITKSGYANDMARLVDGLEVGHILAAISSLEAPHRAWLNYCYGPDNNLYDRSTIGVYIFWKLHFQHNGRSYPKRLALCKCAADDYRIQLSQSKQLPLEYYCHEMEITPTWDGKYVNWDRDWKIKREQALDILRDMDNESVAEVSITTKYLKGQQEPDFRPHYIPKEVVAR